MKQIDVRDLSLMDGASFQVLGKSVCRFCDFNVSYFEKILEKNEYLAKI
jgi:hypothetical protein